MSRFSDAAPASDLHAVGRLVLWLFDGKPPLAWGWFIMRATSSSPALRYRSAKAMKRALGIVRVIEKVPHAAAALAAVAITLAVVRTTLHQDPLPICADDISFEFTEYDYPFLPKPVKRQAPVITLKEGMSQTCSNTPHTSSNLARVLSSPTIQTIPNP